MRTTCSGGVGVASFAIVEQSAYTCLQVYGIEVVLNSTGFCRKNDGFFGFGIKAHQVYYNPFTCCKLFDLLPVGVEEVQMVVSVFLTLQDKMVFIPRNERYGVRGMHILVARLGVECGRFITRGRVVGIKRVVILRPIQFDKINKLAVGSPSDVGEIPIRGVARIEVDCFSCVQVVHSNSHKVRFLASHGIVNGSFCGNTGVNVHQRVVGHHGLVHSVEGQLLSVVAPERSFVNTKLIAVHALSVNNVTTSVC